MANNDRVYEAYIGEMGEDFKANTQKRIEWIIEQSKDTQNVLDIGCSQGIIPCLLAEMGKTVIGIDIRPEAIEYAGNLLETKYTDVKENVKFICSDFMEDVRTKSWTM